MSPAGRLAIQPLEVHTAVWESSSRYQPDWSSSPEAICGMFAVQVAHVWVLPE
jgi:hypothetical protein